MHSRICSIRDFYPLDTSSILLPLSSCDNKNSSRFCEVPPWGQNYLLLRSIRVPLTAVIDSQAHPGLDIIEVCVPPGIPGQVNRLLNHLSSTVFQRPRLKETQPSSIRASDLVSHFPFKPVRGVEEHQRAIPCRESFGLAIMRIISIYFLFLRINCMATSNCRGDWKIIIPLCPGEKRNTLPVFHLHSSPSTENTFTSFYGGDNPSASPFTTFSSSSRSSRLYGVVFVESRRHSSWLSDL